MIRLTNALIAVSIRFLVLAVLFVIISEVIENLPIILASGL